MNRRRSKASALTVIYWRDIPAQVTATHEGASHKALLAPRFQHAIDRAATVAGLTETHAYVGEWRQEKTELTDDPALACQRRADLIEQDFDRDRLEALVAGGGYLQDP